MDSNKSFNSSLRFLSKNVVLYFFLPIFLFILVIYTIKYSQGFAITNFDFFPLLFILILGTILYFSKLEVTVDLNRITFGIKLFRYKKSFQKEAISNLKIINIPSIFTWGIGYRIKTTKDIGIITSNGKALEISLKSGMKYTLSIENKKDFIEFTEKGN